MISVVPSSVDAACRDRLATGGIVCCRFCCRLNPALPGNPRVQLRQISRSVNGLTFSCRTFPSPLGRLISVRSEVQLFPAPPNTKTLSPFGDHCWGGVVFFSKTACFDSCFRVSINIHAQPVAFLPTSPQRPLHLSGLSRTTPPSGITMRGQDDRWGPRGQRGGARPTAAGAVGGTPAVRGPRYSPGTWVTE